LLVLLQYRKKRERWDVMDEIDGWELLYFITSLVSSLTLVGWDAQDVVESWIWMEVRKFY